MDLTLHTHLVLEEASYARGVKGTVKEFDNAGT